MALGLGPKPASPGQHLAESRALGHLALDHLVKHVVSS